ncbi:uncharacterized protein [Apostichopus japonicus]|uniref:uncharacterized protein isoform X2 n=1 Tax=Stichopus japonicus TaxID=307972 RepID=UPI003AB655E3
MAEHAKDILQGGGSSKWVGDKDPKSGDAVAITDPQQFARQGQDHKEYKKKIRQERFGYKTHPGPISEVLAGITYGDACRTQARPLVSSPTFKDKNDSFLPEIIFRG